MADLKATIRDMLKRGMTPEQVKENLAELGVENADEMLAAATENIKGVSLEATAPKREAQEPRGEEMTEMQLSADQPQQPTREPPVENIALRTMPGGAEEKLDDAIALLKALHEINKKILETNREVLLRLK